jgi:hypothetical protein
MMGKISFICISIFCTVASTTVFLLSFKLSSRESLSNSEDSLLWNGLLVNHHDIAVNESSSQKIISQVFESQANYVSHVIDHIRLENVFNWDAITFWSSDFHISPIADIKNLLQPTFQVPLSINVHTGDVAKVSLQVSVIDKSLSGHCHLQNTCQT